MVQQHLEEGWQTLRFRPDWSGQVYAIRFGTSSATSVDIDDVRIVNQATPVAVGLDGPVSLTATGTAQEGFDPAVYGIDPPVSDGPGGQMLFDPTVLPAGTYTLTDDSGESVDLVVIEPPRLQIDNPDVTGGEDFITVVSGDPRDFSQPSDVAVLGDATDPSYAGGVLSATNTSNDSFVSLRMNGALLDPTRYHRVTVTFDNEGPWDLGYGDGGGSHGRLIWTRPDQAFGDSGEILAYPHYDTYTWSMLSSIRAVEDGIGWTSGPIAQLRFDPNEDPGARRWSIDEVAVRAADESFGRFDVQWRDTTPAVLDVASTVVSIGIDSDREGFDGPLVADAITMTEGVNTTEVDTCGLSPGTYWVYITAERGPATVAEYASRPLQVINGAC